jgi:hypothetical protein
MTDLGLAECASREAGHYSLLPVWRGRPVQLGMDEVTTVAVCSVHHCHKGQSRGDVIGREHPSRCSLGRSLRHSLSHLVPGVAAASIVGGMRFRMKFRNVNVMV